VLQCELQCLRSMDVGKKVQVCIEGVALCVAVRVAVRVAVFEVYGRWQESAGWYSVCCIVCCSACCSVSCSV